MESVCKFSRSLFDLWGIILANLYIKQNDANAVLSRYCAFLGSFLPRKIVRVENYPEKFNYEKKNFFRLFLGEF